MVKRKVLIVDDEDGVRDLLALVIEDTHEVKTADSTAAAIAICENFHPDVVFTDVNMPGESGLSLAEKINSRYPETAIILITGQLSQSVPTKELNIQGFLEKPFTNQDFIEALEGALQSLKRA